MERGPASRLRAFAFAFRFLCAFAFAFPPTPMHACSEQNSAAQGRPCIRVPPLNGPRASCTGTLATLATLAREEEEVPTARPLSEDRWERTPCSRKSEAADWDWDWDWKEG